MTDVILKVEPAVGGGWWLECDLPLEPTYFRSGADAERVARNLALRLSDAGRDACLYISDLAHQPVATHRYFALDDATLPAHLSFDYKQHSAFSVGHGDGQTS